MKVFSAIVLTLVAQASQAQTCEDLYTPEFSFTTCLVENLATCTNAACSTSSDFEFTPGVVKTCAEVEEELCPDIRCCEECWVQSQLTYQCSVVDPTVQAGLIEANCTIDCSRFAVGITSPPTTAPVSTITPPSPTTSPPSMAPVDLYDFFPTSSPVVKKCDEDAETQKFDDCVEANGCDKDITCYSRVNDIQFDITQNDICAYFEPVLCIVDDCCSQCSAAYRNLMDCLTEGPEGALIDCNNLNCGSLFNGGGGSDSGAFAAHMTTTALATALLVVGLLE